MCCVLLNVTLADIIMLLAAMFFWTHDTDNSELMPYYISCWVIPCLCVGGPRYKKNCYQIAHVPPRYIWRKIGVVVPRITIGEDDINFFFLLE